jgi:multiple sugar transport system ATP-binding protein
MGQITLSGVTKRFGDAEVIPPLDLDIGDGEFVVFVGPRAAASPPCCASSRGSRTRARPHRHRRPGRDRRAARKRRLAMVFQSYALYPT